LQHTSHDIRRRKLPSARSRWRSRRVRPRRMRSPPLPWLSHCLTSNCTSSSFLSSSSLVHSSSSSLACSLASRRRSAYGPFALLSVSETSASFTSADVSPSQSQENDSPISTPAADPGAVADAARNLLLALQRERRETTAKSQADTEVAVSAFFAVVAPWSPSSERQIDALLVQLSAMAPHCGRYSYLQFVVCSAQMLR
jgi:hypothetical protein